MFKKIADYLSLIAWKVSFYAESIFWLVVTCCGLGLLMWNR